MRPSIGARKNPVKRHIFAPFISACDAKDSSFDASPPQAWIATLFDIGLQC